MPILGAEPNGASANIDQRLRDIDLNLLLAHYEKIQKQIIELRFQEAMLDAQDMPDDERKRQVTRINKMENVLTSEKHNCLARIRELSAEKVKQDK